MCNKCPYELCRSRKTNGSKISYTIIISGKNFAVYAACFGPKFTATFGSGTHKSKKLINVLNWVLKHNITLEESLKITKYINKITSLTSK